MPNWLVLLVTHRIPRYVASWLVVAGIVTGLLTHTRWAGFHNPNRADGHSGHTTVDFGWQWLMGRTLVTGHGDELYFQARLWKVAQDAYPPSAGAPDQKQSDAEQLVSLMIGEDDPERAQIAFIAMVPLSSPDPLSALVMTEAVSSALAPERLDRLATPKRPDELGGALYPPIHSLYMAPFATGDHPQAAYFAMQWILLASAFVTGLAVRFLSEGRVWWPVATAIVLAYPGFRGSLDLGQNAPIALALLTVGWTLGAKGRPAMGGFIWGLLAFKPTWALSFLLVLVLMRRWRMMFAMASTGLGLIVMSLPFVGIQAWYDWLAVGQKAAALYNVDFNWVSLSRDLFGIPRRFFIDFDAPRDERENFPAAWVGWLIWLAVLDVTLRVRTLLGRKRVPNVGPFPALLLLTAWACSYRFMYYDILVSALGMLVLLSEPRRFFTPRLFRPAAEPTSSGRTVLTPNSVVLTLLGLMFLLGNGGQGLDLQATVAAGRYVTTIESKGETIKRPPQVKVSSSLQYPWDTILAMGIWASCVGMCAFSRVEDAPERTLPVRD